MPSYRPRVTFMLGTADGHNGVARSVFNTAGYLAPSWDVEIIGLFQRRSSPVYEVPPGVSLRFLQDLRPNSSRHGLVERQLSRAPSRLLGQPGSSPLKGSSLLTDMLLLQSLQALQSDVLVTTRAELHVAAARFAPSQVTLVAQEHMHYFQRSQKVRHSVDECIGRIAALVVLTEGDRHDYLQESPWPRSKVSVIPNAVRGTLLSPVVQREKLIVAAGRLTEQKGFDRLIDAYAPIARSHPDWRLHIFGKGPDRRKLQRRINDHGISQQIRLKGWEDRLDLVFNRAAVLALASRYEGLPLVIIEAMAQGLPVISFNCPTGPRDLVRHGETGFLVPNGDIDAFSRALKRLINNADLRESMGEAARTDARRYHLSTVGQQWDSLLDTLLMARSTASPRRAGGRENLGGKPLWAARRVRAARSEGVRV